MTISAPVVSMPAPGGSTVACLNLAVAPTPPSVLDNCGRTLSVSSGVPGSDPSCAGSKTWTFTYTDCANQTYLWIYTYTILAPVVSMPASGSSVVTCYNLAIMPTPPNVLDNCNRPLSISVGVPGNTPSCNGNKTWTFTYTDCANSNYTWVYTYTITDNISPSFTAPSDITINPNPNCIYDANPTITGLPSALADNCTSVGNLITTYSDVIAPGQISGGYTITRSWKVTDCPANFTIHSQIITVTPCNNNACDSVVWVTTINDNGPGSLRWAIERVCNNGYINFDCNLDGKIIVLTSGTLVIDKNITFDNCCHNSGIKISGNGNLITINPTKSLTLSCCSKFTVTGPIINNAGVSGFILTCGGSFIYDNCDLPATAKRYLNNGWHLFGSPFYQNLGSTLANLTPSGGSVQLKPYINGNNWTYPVTSPVFSLLPGVGYAVKPNTNFTATLSGILFCVPCLNTISLTYNGSLPNQSWNLIANPYTSYLNWSLLGKTNISTTLYLWDNSLYPNLSPITTTTYFRTYNSTNGVGVPAGTLGFIAPMQGFFVKAIYNSPKISFPPNARTHSTAPFYKEVSNTEILLRLKTESDGGYDELAICKNPNAKTTFEEFDSEKLFNELPLEMYTESSNGQKLIINTIDNTNTVIPLGINISGASKAKITSFGLESNEAIYLEDRLKGKLISLTENTSYEFDFSSEAILGRFFIRFSDNIKSIYNSDCKVFTKDNQLNIVAQTGEELQQVEIYSLTGACVFSSKLKGSNVFNTSLDLSADIYLVRVKTSLTTQNVKISWK